MKIKLLADFRGRITNEVFYKAGVHDLPDEIALALIADDRAVSLEKAPEPEPEAAKPKTTRTKRARKPKA